MRRQATIGVMCVCAVLVCTSLAADEKPTEAYQKAMKELGVTSQALRAEVKTIESAGAYPTTRRSRSTRQSCDPR